MLIGGDDISNNAITLGMCFSTSVSTVFCLVIVLLILPIFSLDDTVYIDIVRTKLMLVSLGT